MNIHEYQAKEILNSFGIPIPRSRVALTADQVERAAKEMGGHCVVKAQIYAGGRAANGTLLALDAFQRGATVAPVRLLPVYLRPSEAEYAKLGQQKSHRAP